MHTDRLQEAVLPCGHDVAFFEPTTGTHYNLPERPGDGVIRIVPGYCDICETPIREFYSGELEGPFLTREAFRPDADPHETDRS